METNTQQPVRITDINVPFSSVFSLLLKVWLAGLILGLASWVLWAIVYKLLTIPFIK